MALSIREETGKRSVVMEYRVLGRTGMRVSVLGLGTGQFGAFGQTTLADCERVAHRAFDGGVNLVDTADFYSLGECEEIVGQIIADRRDRLVLATKCGFAVSDEVNERGGSRAWIMKAVDRSLRRLRTDYIDLYQLHAPDYDTDVAETLEAMNDLLRAGKIRAFGLSNTPGQRFTEAALCAQVRGLNAPHSEQQSYSLFIRGPERELLPACLRYGAGVLAYSPLDGGWLSGKYRHGRESQRSFRQRLQPAKYDLETDLSQRKLDVLDALAEIAAEAGHDLAHMAMAFVLAHPAVTTALFGGSKTEYVDHYLAGADLRLSDEVLDRIDAVMAPGSSLQLGDGTVTPVPDSAMRRRHGGPKALAPSGTDYIRKVISQPA